MFWVALNFSLLLIAKISYNIWQRKNGQDVPHTKQILIVAAEVVAVTHLSLGVNWHAVVTDVLQAVWWSILFDIGYNLAWGREPIFYVDDTAPSDRFFRTFKHPEATMLATKLVLLSIVMYLFIII